ncbi:glycosyltransferase family 2 protein [Pedobacter sandarakinus]|uniref:glycosyltransferase family 2 protein n=1 Tax=Pedobacter sandarakinus TaxID=353156 RepID=UPI0022456E2B|nr:glycosyltransferase family 2 protein [Pedobacter sandarakinus]MCX2575924.1 glycosyltransferase family 2 protein [Pedobacter sandarakinus]
MQSIITESLQEILKQQSLSLPGKTKSSLQPVVYTSDGLLEKLPKLRGEEKGWPWDDQVDPKTYNEEIPWPKLTIVMPSFNQGAFIEQTIRSVLLQNYPNLEFIIIDGGSTDCTVQILEQYSPWISYWQSEKDNGQGHAINIGFGMASGDYYAWINSDDYYTKNTFSLVMAAFKQKGVAFVYGHSANFTVATKTLQKVTVQPLLDFFIRIPILQQPACFWIKTIHQPVWEDLQCSMDYELWLRMVKGKKKRRLPHILAIANVHDEAKTSSAKMGLSWRKDHELICSPEAHGPVYHWDLLIFLNRIYLKLISVFEK